MDSFGERGQLLANMDRLLNYNKELAKTKESGQTSLFADMSAGSGLSKISLSPAPPAEQNEKLAWEKELLGLYVSEHPYNMFRPYLTGYAILLAKLKEYRGQDRVITAGIISSVKKIITRKGESMLFIKLEDATNSVELLIFPRLYKENPDVWIPGQAIIIEGSVSEKDQETKFLVNRLGLLNQIDPRKSIDDFKRVMMEAGPPRNNYRRNGNGAGSASSKSASVTKQSPSENKSILEAVPQKKSNNPLRLISLKDLSANDLNELKKIFSLYPGEDEVYFKINEQGKAKIVKTAFQITNTSELKKQIESSFAELIKIVS